MEKHTESDQFPFYLPWSQRLENLFQILDKIQYCNEKQESAQAFNLLELAKVLLITELKNYPEIVKSIVESPSSSCSLFQHN